MNVLIKALDNKDDFYPTPPKLQEKMLAKIVNWLFVETVLEPSAGKGDLIRAIESRTRHVDIDAIEIEPHLQSVIKDSGYRLVHDDFLTYNTYKHYDLIFANFPFSAGAKHLLKALQMQENGGAIVALINAETLRNQCNAERKTLHKKLVECNADIEYLSDEFKEAERKTSVEVALVSVLIEKPQKESFLFNRLKKARGAEGYQAKKQGTELTHADYIDAILAQYDFETRVGLELINEWTALKPYILDSIKTEYSHEILELKLYGLDEYYTMEDGYIKQTRMKYWKALFQNPKFTVKLTKNLKEELYNRVSTLRDYEFSKFNIMEIQAEINRNTAKGVEDTILALFDNLSGDHAWYPETKNNIHYYNGWATNKAHKINKKVILPMNGFSAWSYSGKVKYKLESYKLTKTISDMLKTLDYLTGRSGIERDVCGVLSSSKESDNSKNIEFDYFTVDLYKKGTAHIKFKSQEIVDILNIFGARKRNWLPPYYGKVDYDDMPEEAKTVIDEFQGRSQYEKVMRNTDLYLFEPDRILMIEG